MNLKYNFFDLKLDSKNIAIYASLAMTVLLFLDFYITDKEKIYLSLEKQIESASQINLNVLTVVTNNILAIDQPDPVMTESYLESNIRNSFSSISPYPFWKAVDFNSDPLERANILLKNELLNYLTLDQIDTILAKKTPPNLFDNLNEKMKPIFKVLKDQIYKYKVSKRDVKTIVLLKANLKNTISHEELSNESLSNLAKVFRIYNLLDTQARLVRNEEKTSLEILFKIKKTILIISSLLSLSVLIIKQKE